MRSNLGLIFLLLAISIIPTHIVGAQGSERSVEIPLQDLNGGVPLELRGLSNDLSVEFSLPTNWKLVRPAKLRLSLSVSELLSKSDSSVTISLNGLKVSSRSLNELVNGGSIIEIPPAFFISGVNKLTFEGLLRLPEDLATNCEGWENPARWATIDQRSNLLIAFEEQPLPADLSNFPSGFLQPLDRYLFDGRDTTYFVVPDRLEIDDLNALSTTAYYLGHQAGSDYELKMTVLTKREFDALGSVLGNIVFVNFIPEQFANDVSDEKNAIGIFTSPWDTSRLVMVIYDKDRSDGYSPSTVFSNWTRGALLHGNVAYIEKSAATLPPDFKTKYSFEELGYLDRTVRGIGTGNMIYTIYIPYQVDPVSSVLSLQIAHAPDLDARTSSITIYLNGFAVASILPATTVSRQEPIRVDLPADRFRPGKNYIRISFDMHVPYINCERDADTIWGTVFNSSSIRFSYKDRTSLPLLNDFPTPFNDTTSSAIVMPDFNDERALERLSNFSYMLGSSSFYAISPPSITTASKFTPVMNQPVNYIFVGLPTENLSFQLINDYLPQPFVANSNELLPGFNVFLPDVATSANVGLLQIAPSPWHPNSIFAVITGTDSTGLDWAWNAILDSENRKQFNGNIMIVGPDHSSSLIDAQLPGQPKFYQSVTVTNIPLIGKYLQSNGLSEETISLLAIALVGIVALIALKASPLLKRIELKIRKPSESNEKE